MRSKGTGLMVLGLILILAACGLSVYNMLESRQAETASTQLTQALLSQMPTEAAEESGETLPEGDFPELIPDHVRFPNMEMPVVNIDGRDYVGMLTIPSLELELPVISQWSYPDLKIAPCRYLGSAYSDDLIIMAHNYASHFGNLKNLRPGESVIFTDMDGNRFTYLVVELETLDGTAVEDMEAGDWDLTLFTCTYGGKSRITLRCDKEK